MRASLGGVAGGTGLRWKSAAAMDEGDGGSLASNAEGRPRDISEHGVDAPDEVIVWDGGLARSAQQGGR